MPGMPSAPAPASTHHYHLSTAPTAHTCSVTKSYQFLTIFKINDGYRARMILDQRAQRPGGRRAPIAQAWNGSAGVALYCVGRERPALHNPGGSDVDISPPRVVRRPAPPPRPRLVNCVLRCRRPTSWLHQILLFRPRQPAPPASLYTII